MSQNPTLDDFRLSTSILNFLVGGFQGIVSFHTALGKLNHPLFSEEARISAEKVITKIADALIETYNGNPTFYCSWTEADSFEAASFIDALEKLSSSLSALSSQLENFFKSMPLDTSNEMIELLLASFARRVLGTDAYLQEQLRTAISLADDAQTRNNSMQMDALAPELEELSEIGSRAFEKQLSTDDISLLLKKTRDYSFIFAAQAHESRVLSRTYAATSNFEDFGIAKEEADKWAGQSIDPVTAGYFSAYGLDIEDLIAWTDAEFYDAVEIFSWKMSGFPPHVAAEWRSMNFYPEEALPWMKAGYKPEMARAEVDKGTTTPKKSSSFTTRITSPKPSATNLSSTQPAMKPPVIKGPARSHPQSGNKDISPDLSSSLMQNEPKVTAKPDNEPINQIKGSPDQSKENHSKTAQSSDESSKRPFKTRNTFTIKKPKT